VVKKANLAKFTKAKIPSIIRADLWVFLREMDFEFLNNEHRKTNIE
jgi:hypothetical protein